MGTIPPGLPAVAGLAVLAGTCAELAGHRAFARLVRRDVEALYARASPAAGARQTTRARRRPRRGAPRREALTSTSSPTARWPRSQSTAASLSANATNRSPAPSAIGRAASPTAATTSARRRSR